jgi:hypothetical protein
VINQVEMGNVDPLAIGAACSGIAVTDILAEVEALLGAGGPKIASPTPFQARLMALRLNCQKLLASDGGGDQ